MVWSIYHLILQVPWVGSWEECTYLGQHRYARLPFRPQWDSLLLYQKLRYDRSWRGSTLRALRLSFFMQLWYYFLKVFLESLHTSLWKPSILSNWYNILQICTNLWTSLLSSHHFFKICKNLFKSAQFCTNFYYILQMAKILYDCFIVGFLYLVELPFYYSVNIEFIFRLYKLYY